MRHIHWDRRSRYDSVCHGISCNYLPSSHFFVSFHVWRRRRIYAKSFSKFMVDRRDLFVAPARTQQHATMRLEQFFRIIARYMQLKCILSSSSCIASHSERVKYRFNNENLLLCIKLICVEIEALFSRIKCYCSFLYRETTSEKSFHFKTMQRIYQIFSKKLLLI